MYDRTQIFIGNHLTDVIETTYNHAASWNARHDKALQAISVCCSQETPDLTETKICCAWS